MSGNKTGRASPYIIEIITLVIIYGYYSSMLNFGPEYSSMYSSSDFVLVLNFCQENHQSQSLREYLSVTHMKVPKRGKAILIKRGEMNDGAT